MAKLKPWYDVVELREDLKEGRPLDASEFAVHLDQVRDGRATKDYTDPQRFFDRTYFTDSLLDLAAQVARRLSGVRVETSAVFNMSTQFGGGKSHALTALYHLARNGPQANRWRGVADILAKANVKSVPEADVAVFVGTEFDPIAGRGGDGEPKRKTIWGEVAWQLGGAKGFAAVAEHDAKGVAPGGDVIRAMLPTGPCLILMDELLNYASRWRHLVAGVRDQLFNFLHNLSEEARGRDNLVLCVALPQSVTTEMNPDDERDYESIKKMLDRLGKALMMSAGGEIAEIIRRRLFEWKGLDDDARKTVAAYADWAVEHSQELTGFDADTAREQFERAYPFHPSVLSVFERKWASLARFQRTRGILRLLALWVAYNHREEHTKSTKEPLVTLGLAPLQDPVFRAAMFDQLGGDKLEIPLTTDIVGKTDAHALRLDKEAADAVKKGQLHRKVAAAIFFESNGGMSQARAEATVPEVRTAVFGPDANMADLDNVLEALTSTCFYLNWDKNRFRFGLTPNLNQILVSRRGAVQPKAVEEKVRQVTQKLFDKHTIDASRQVDRRYWPARSNDVPNKPALALVVLGLDHPAGEKTTTELMESIVRECGSSGRTYKSAVLFAVPDAGDTIRSAVRDLLAWEAIDDDEATKKGLDEGQRRVLQRSAESARKAADEAVFRAYRRVALLGKDGQIRDIDLGPINPSASGSVVELILRELERSDEITASVGSNRLVKLWPGSLVEWPTKGVRDAFYSSPQLPRLLNPDAIKRTIADGVRSGDLGYATRGAGGRLKLEKFKESMSEAEVEISDDVFILRAADAVKLKDSPRLAGLRVRPENPTVKPGEQVAFTCSAHDQYGDSFPLTVTTWSSVGGAITPAGLYTAGPTTGRDVVRAEALGHQAVVEVRVDTPELKPDDRDDGKPEPKPGKRTIRWHGTVPPQKWMNFYTKVLTRFAGSSDLKLEVSFEVSVDREQAQSKADDTRTGLKELGLDDNVAQS
jgi:hypothetical protein